MFRNSSATTGYARTQADADRFNNSSNKPSALVFVKTKIKEVDKMIQVIEGKIKQYKPTQNRHIKKWLNSKWISSTR